MPEKQAQADLRGFGRPTLERLPVLGRRAPLFPQMRIPLRRVRLILVVTQGVRLRPNCFLHRLTARVLRFSGALLFSAAVLHAQSLPTASRGVVPSVFAGITGTYTGLDGGRNLGLTAGFDVGFRPFFGLLPSIEGRGTYPIDNGSVVGEEYAAGGLRVQKRYGPFRPYVDLLFGRGELNYQNGGLAVPLQAFRYVQTTSNVISPGLGFEVDVSEKFAVKFDGQFQIWDVPFDPSGATTNSSHIHSFPGTIGVVYRFNWLQHGHPAP